MRFILCIAALALVSALNAVGPGGAVDDHLRQLAQPNSRDKYDALNALADLGPKAEKAIPNLVALLGDPDANLRLRSAIALGRIGKAAVPALTERLNDRDSEVRFYAISALGWIGPDAKATAPAIAKALTDQNAGVRRKAAYALGKSKSGGPEVAAALVQALGDPDRYVYDAVSEALPSFGVDTVEPLRALLKRRSGLELKAMHFLSLLGPAAEAALPELTEILNDPTAGASRTAADTMVKIGPSALKFLASGLDSIHSEVGEAAVSGLTKFGEPAAPALVDALRSKHTTVRREAARSLGILRAGDKAVVQGLADSLQDQDEAVRFNAMDALYALRDQAKHVSPQVEKVMVDSSLNTRWLAFHFLVETGADLRPALTKALAIKDDAIRLEIAVRMMNLDAAPELALPVLTELLKHKDNDIRFQAAKTLGPRGLNRALVLDALGVVLKESEYQRRVEVVEILKAIGKPAVPTLITGLKDPSFAVLLATTRALGEIGPDAAAAIPALTKLTNDADFEVGESARKALERIKR